MPKDTTKAPNATTPEDNGYCPQCGSYDPCYSGDLDEQDTEFEERDSRVTSTRAEFHKPKESKDLAD
jgi:hypothetical protein